MNPWGWPGVRSIGLHSWFSTYSIRVCVYVCAQLLLPLCDPMDCGPPGSSTHGISRQEYWRGLPFPTPRDLPDPGIEPASPVSPALQADSLPAKPSGWVWPAKRNQPQQKVRNSGSRHRCLLDNLALTQVPRWELSHKDPSGFRLFLSLVFLASSF